LCIFRTVVSRRVHNLNGDISESDGVAFCPCCARVQTSVSVLPTMNEPPNRIRELREARGITSSETLAELVGVSGATIRRLELGDTKLTVPMMQRLARVLQCMPSDLISTAMVADVADEVEAVRPEEVGSIRGLASRGFQFWRVTGDSLANAGVDVGDIIAVDISTTTQPKPGDCVVVRLTRDGHPPATVLRQWLPPGLLTTNRPGLNTSLQVENDSFRVDVIGVILRD